MERRNLKQYIIKKLCDIPDSNSVAKMRFREGKEKGRYLVILDEEV